MVGGGGICGWIVMKGIGIKGLGGKWYLKVVGGGMYNGGGGLYGGMGIG